MFIQTVTFASPEYDETVALRYQILRKPLGLEFSAEALSEEYKDIHFALYDQDYHLQACLILSQHKEDPSIAKMRQVAVLTEAQGKGIGTQLVQAFEDYARQHDFKEIQLEARDVAVPFYLKLNYELFGEPYTAIGIPHRWMRKKL